MQGFPRCFADTTSGALSNRALADLAGEAIFIPCLTSVILAMWSLPQFWASRNSAKPSGPGEPSAKKPRVVRQPPVVEVASHEGDNEEAGASQWSDV
jgi:hypothetical protein